MYRYSTLITKNHLLFYDVLTTVIVVYYYAIMCSTFL